MQGEQCASIILRNKHPMSTSLHWYIAELFTDSAFQFQNCKTSGVGAVSLHWGCQVQSLRAASTRGKREFCQRLERTTLTLSAT